MSRRPKPNLDRMRLPSTDTASRGLCVLNPKDVGDVVRLARTWELGRQAEAAERLGVSLAMLSDLERGAGGSQLNLTLGVLADLGFDVVLVPRDPSRSLQQTLGGVDQ